MLASTPAIAPFKLLIVALKLLDLSSVPPACHLSHCSVSRLGERGLRGDQLCDGILRSGRHVVIAERELNQALRRWNLKAAAGRQAGQRIAIEPHDLLSRELDCLWIGEGGPILRVLLALLVDLREASDDLHARQVRTEGFRVAHPLKLDDLILNLLNLFKRRGVLCDVLLSCLSYCNPCLISVISQFPDSRGYGSGHARDSGGPRFEPATLEQHKEPR